MERESMALTFFKRHELIEKWPAALTLHTAGGELGPIGVDVQLACREQDDEGDGFGELE